MVDLAWMNVDFASLRTLKLVHERRSFTEAANVLDVNQSAVSYTIDKLRRVFQDPLFFRQGGKIVPTDRCNSIFEVASDLIEQFELLAEPETFEPAKTEQTISVACNYYERRIILPKIAAQLRRLAPGLRLNLINSSHEGDEQLKRSEAQILIGPLRPNTQDFYCRKLLNEHYVCVMDTKNKLAKEPLTIKSYTQCPHITVTYGGTWRSGFLSDIETAGLMLNEVLWVPSPASLDDFIQGTDLVATVPARVASAYAGKLHIAECPFPGDFQIDLIWTTRTHHSPMHIWLRNLISQTVKDELL